MKGSGLILIVILIGVTFASFEIMNISNMVIKEYSSGLDSSKLDLSMSERYNPPDSVSLDKNNIVKIFRGDTVTVINLNFK